MAFELLDLPYISLATDLQVASGTATIKREAKGASRKWEETAATKLHGGKWNGTTATKSRRGWWHAEKTKIGRFIATKLDRRC